MQNFPLQFTFQFVLIIKDIICQHLSTVYCTVYIPIILFIHIHAECQFIVIYLLILAFPSLVISFVLQYPFIYIESTQITYFTNKFLSVFISSTSQLMFILIFLCFELFLTLLVLNVLHQFLLLLSFMSFFKAVLNPKSFIQFGSSHGILLL